MRNKYVHLKGFHEFFPSKFQQIQIISVSGHFIYFIFKICQIAADISMIKQFHEFFSLIFGGILQLIFSKQVSAGSNHFRFWSFHSLHIQNLSNCIRHKYDQTISRIFQPNFWRNFAIQVPMCCGAPAKSVMSSRP